jgi:hypothetical protein
MITPDIADDIVEALWSVKATLWEKHGYRRIYVNTANVYNGAGCRMNPADETQRFYLNLDTAKWMLTGNVIDRQLAAYLNELAECDELDEAYAELDTKEQAKRKERSIARTSDAAIRKMDDATLIELIETSPLEEHTKANMWAYRIREVEGLSSDVILAIIAVSPRWYHSQEIMSQENFPAGYKQRLLAATGYKGEYAQYVARCGTAADAGLLELIAENSTDTETLYFVGKNKNTPFKSLLSLAGKVLTEALVSHPQVTDEILAKLAENKRYAEHILWSERHLSQETTDAIKRHNDNKMTKKLMVRHPYAFTAKQMLSVSDWFNVLELQELIKNEKTPTEVIMGLIREHRQTVRATARLELERRGYSETSTKPAASV